MKEREKAMRERLRQEKREQAEREKEARRIQREEERRAKEREREEERARKEAERRAREREKEEERARKEEEKRAREREKEEERARKEEERRAREREKEEERLKREEERRAKEEERRRREAERAREEEERQRKLEKQRAIMKAFVVLNKSTEIAASSATAAKADPNSRFMQFELKKDQRLAPTCRIESASLLERKWQNIEDLSLSWREKDHSATDASRVGLTLFGRPNYLLELKKGQIEPLSYPPTWPLEPPEGLGWLIQDMSRQLFNYADSGNGGVVWVRTKYLYFAENIRPAYHGTYRSRSRVVGPRRPFAKDVQRLDYDFDSDEEWEDGGGESISQSEEEEEDEEESDEDAKFFVPHGYLSDDEKEGAEDPDDDDSVQMKKFRQQLSLAEYEAVHRRGSSKLHPFIIGPLWSQKPLNGTPDADDDKENYRLVGENGDRISEREFVLRSEALSNYAVYLWPDESLPVSVSIKSTRIQPAERDRKRFPASAVPYLVRLLHKNPLSKAKLQFEFRVFWFSHTWSGEGKPPVERFVHFQDIDVDPEPQPQQSSSSKVFPISKAAVLRKIGEIGVFEEGRWRVRPEVLEANKEAVLALEGLPPVFEGSKQSVSLLDPSFEFPPWPYLTDVKAVSKRRSVISSPSALPQTPSNNVKQASDEQPSNETSSGPRKRATLTDFFASPPALKKPKIGSGGTAGDDI